MISALSGGLDVFLQPGEFYFGDADTVIRTTLGSCVAITLWHPRRRVGGMCHYLLPSRSGRDGGAAGRYADEAMELFFKEIAAVGTRLSDYEAKLFGGASMFNHRRGVDVAGRNVIKAQELTLRYGLKVRAQSLGGTGHRQLIFDIRSGDVWVRQARQPARQSRDAGSA